MTRDAEVPQQAEGEVQFPQERGALYDLPKVSSNDLIGEVIDILGYYGPFKSAEQYQNEKGSKRYIVCRFKGHSTLKYTNPEGVKSTLPAGEEATTTASAVRVIERIIKAAPAVEDGETVISPPLRGLLAEEKTAQGYKIRTLKAPPSDWTPA